MCGIFAYLNFNINRERRYILQVLFNGLRRLEYRGYDSAGISIDNSPSDPLFSLQSSSPSSTSSFSSQSLPPLVFRQEGNIESLVKSVYQEVSAVDLNLEESFPVHAGIAHTRWATHGEPAPRNSHPQSSGDGNDFLVVHNGVITNYKVLKETLVRHGFTFESETDTEVIPKLAKYVFDKANEVEGAQPVTFSQVVLEVMRHLEGAYALIFKSRHYPNELIACKRGSPLLLGVKEPNEDAKCGSAFPDSKFLSKDGQPKELFLSSDANAIVEHTRRVLMIEDGEVVHLKDGSVSILKFENNKGRHGGSLSRPASVQRALSVLEMEVEQINKGKYEHYMQKEIHEQAESLTTTMRGRLIRGGSSKGKTVLLGGLKDHLKTIRRSRRIVFIGCGTSYNAALAARPILEELSGVPVTMEIASDLVDRQGPIYREDTAVFVSQSGETADTLHALEYALENGALCVGITNTVGSAIARTTHCGVHINAGAEIGVASTKAYTSQIVVMAILALAIGGDAISTQAKREAIIDGLFDLPNKVREVLKLDQEMKDLAKLLMAEQSLLVFGRGYNYATALEGALKVKEVALMHSEGMLAGEMKHGPLALVDENLPIIVIATRDSCFSKQQSVIQQLHARKGRLIVMCSKGDAASVCPGESCRVIEVPQVEDCLQPVVNIVPLQLLAYHLTVLRGYNVDQPRNLAKSVTTQLSRGVELLLRLRTINKLHRLFAPSELRSPPDQNPSLQSSESTDDCLLFLRLRIFKFQFRTSFCVTDQLRMRMKLFDDDETENVNISKLEINTEFARRYEHNKRREDLQRYEELLRNGQIRESDIESDSESSSDEEDAEINKLSKKKDIKLFENLNRIKVRDPSVYQPGYVFECESDGDDSDNDKEEENKDTRRKPQYLKDVVAQHLIEEGPEFEDAEPSKMKKKKNYFEEQEELKKAFLDEVKNSVEEDDGGDLLKEKKSKDENEGDADGGELQKKLGEYFGPDDALDENSKFLKDFFEKQMWIDRENKSFVVEDDEVDFLLRDDKAVEKQEEYEATINFRYEENAGDRVMGHARTVEGSVRKEKNTRKEQRKNKIERLKTADMERKEELKHLKNLKKKEMKERLMKVYKVAGRGVNDIGLDIDDLDKDFDPEEYDERMNNFFNNEYYNANDVDPEFGSDSDGDIKKPDFDKEDELLGLPKGWNAVENDDGFLAARKRALEKIPENDENDEEEDDDDDDEEVDDDDDDDEEEGRDGTDTEDSNDEDKGEDEERGSAVAKNEEIVKKRKRKEKISLVQRAKEAMLEEYYKLDYEGTVGDLKTRFKYAKVKPNRFGLKTEEVLMLDDKELNQYVSVKKIAPYMENEWKVPSNKKKEYKEKVKELCRGKWKIHGKTSKKNSSRDNGDKTKSASDQERKPELEETNMEVANLSSRKKRKLRQKELKLSTNRRAAYENVQAKKRKH